jgi:hypothetical protein
MTWWQLSLILLLMWLMGFISGAFVCALQVSC